MTNDLRCISGDSRLVVGPCNGMEKNPFEWVDPYFQNYPKSSLTTAPTMVAVCELTKSMTLRWMYDSLAALNLGSFFTLPYQIYDFVNNNYEWLAENGCATFFPLKPGIVAIASIYGAGLKRLEKRDLDYAYPWGVINCKHHFVLPLPH